MLFLRFFCATIIIAIAFTGCGILRHASLKPSERIDKHVSSCGPDSLYLAFKALEKKHNVKFNLSKEKISKLIRTSNKCSDLLRDFLFIWSYQANEITWPNEIKDILTSRGFKIEETKDYKNLTPSQIAIVLVHKKGTLHYHWMCYPIEEDILYFFGDDTIIENIYIIKK